ncbi:hypothetical protein BH23VER1_BH23VER1_08090 [soil metagenome]
MNRATVSVLAALAGWVSVASSSAAEGDLLPHRFGQHTDSLGGLWAVAGDGALGRSSGAIARGMEVSVGGDGMSVTVARGGDDPASPRYQIGGLAGGLIVERDVWIDRERGGIRYLDSFTLPEAGDAEAVTVKVTFMTLLELEMVSMHGTSGGEFEGRLGRDEVGLVANYDPTQGLASAAFLIAAEAKALRPEVGLVDGRELSVTYEVEIAPGQTVTLLHWIVQRMAGWSGDPGGAIEPFYRKRRLMAALVPEDLVETLANFPPGAADDGGFSAPSADALTAVRQLEERLGVQRADKETLWVSGQSQLDGQASGGSIRFTPASVGGGIPLGIDVGDVAALLGGGGRGRQHRLYLRDGTVITGAAEVEGLEISGEQGWRIGIDAGRLEALFFRLNERDGVPPEGATLYVELHSGDVVAAALPGEATLPFLTPWATFEIPVGEIRGLRYVTVPTPRYRLALRDGTRLTGFLGDADLEARTARFGTVQIDAPAVAGAWSAGVEFPAQALGTDDATDISALDPPAPEDVPLCLLVGGNLLGGELADPVLHVVSGTTVTAIPPAELSAIHRAADDVDELSPTFELVLTGGDSLVGKLEEATLTIRTAFGEIRVPRHHFLAARSAVLP